MKRSLVAFALIALATSAATLAVTPATAGGDFQKPFASKPFGPKPFTPTPYAKSPAAFSPGYNWSGFYAGAMGGYGWSGSVPLVGFVDLGSDLKGGFGGGTIGFNWQVPGSPLVWGAEIDAAGTGIRFKELGPLGTFEDKVSAFGSATGRIGWAANATLLYVKGGFAWASNNASATTIPPLVGAQSESKVHAGWTAGVGIEYLFAPSWSAKAEYMYADYGRETYFSNLLDLGMTMHTVKGGINYHFNWGGPAVTRY